MKFQAHYKKKKAKNDGKKMMGKEERGKEVNEVP